GSIHLLTYFVSGGTLEGDGVVLGNVANGYNGDGTLGIGGVVHPMGIPGSFIWILGTYTQSELSELDVDVDSTAQKCTSLLVSHDATISANSKVYVNNPGCSLTYGDYAFITCTTGATLTVGNNIRFDYLIQPWYVETEGSYYRFTPQHDGTKYWLNVAP